LTASKEQKQQDGTGYSVPALSLSQKSAHESLGENMNAVFMG